MSTATKERTIWLNKVEAANHLRCSPRTIESWMKIGKLKEGVHYKKIGYKTLLFDEAALNNL